MPHIFFFSPGPNSDPYTSLDFSLIFFPFIWRIYRLFILAYAIWIPGWPLWATIRTFSENIARCKAWTGTETYRTTVSLPRFRLAQTALLETVSPYHPAGFFQWFLSPHILSIGPYRPGKPEVFFPFRNQTAVFRPDWLSVWHH